MPAGVRPLAILLSGVLFATLLSATAATGQILNGKLVDAGTGLPIDGAFIVLIGSGGLELTGVLSAEDGSFQLRAPKPGTYTLRADRIGYRSTSSSPIELAATGLADYILAVPVDAIALTGITTEAERRCVARPEEGLETARLWEEARKALSAARWTDEQHLHSYQILRYHRVLDPRSLVIMTEETESGWRRSGRPFETPPADQLVIHGFVQVTPAGELYYAPDAGILLSDAFLDTHCFGVRAGEAGLIGLAFKPLPDRSVPDVEGVLWLNESEAELRYLEYSYTGLSFPARMARKFGGRLEFERLPTGAWIIRRWSIRGPIRGLGGRYTAAAVQEEAGEVTEIIASRRRK